MKKLLIILIMLLCCSCSAKREDYYTLSYGDYSLTVGYDDLAYTKLVYDINAPETLDSNDSIKEELFLFGKHFARVYFINMSKKVKPSDKATLSYLQLFFEENPYYSYRIDDYELSDSVKENCEHFNGEYIIKNGTACVIGKVVDEKQNIIILEGDIYGLDQDKIYRLSISVE